MCNQDQPHSHEHEHAHSHGRFESAPLARFRAIGRRRFLSGVGRGTFAVLSEIATARNVIAIALGTTTTGLVACAAPPTRVASTPGAASVATLAPTTAAATAAVTAASTAEATMAATAAATAAAMGDATASAGLSYQQVNLGFVNAYVLVRGNEVAVVDTGVANSQGKIEEVIKAAGRNWGDVRHVILTHYHQDHAGSMDAVMAASTNAIAYAGAADIPQIQTKAKLQELTDGQEVFGLQIVATPGHTSGHMSVYDPLGSAFITGDALVNDGGNIGLSDPQYTADMAMARQSAIKIAGLNFETAYFMHGDILNGGASAAIAKFAETLN